MNKILWSATVLVALVGCLISYWLHLLPSAAVAAGGSAKAADAVVGEKSPVREGRRPGAPANQGASPAEKKSGAGGELAKREERRSAVFTSDGDTRAALAQIRVRLRFHGLYAKLGLTTDEIRRFEQAAAPNFSSIDPLGVELGRNPPDRERALLEMMIGGLAQVVSETLGPERVEAFKAFIATADLQSVADKLAVNTFSTDTPLTAEQAASFVAVCLKQQANPGADLRINIRNIDWQKVTQDSSGFLSGPQLDALRSMVAIMSFDEAFQRTTGLPYRKPVRGF